MSMGIPVDSVKAAIIKEMEGKSFLLPNTLIGRLAKNYGIDPLAIKQALARLTKSGWLVGIAEDGTPFAQVRILGDIPEKTIDPLQSLWLEALRSSDLSEAEMQALAGSWKNLHGLGLEEMQSIVRGLKKLKQDHASLVGLSAYLVSARHLLGSSKLLGMIPSKSLIAFGIAPSHFLSHPPYVVVGGCAEPEAVVLIENPTAFELAMATDATQRCAFIATFGFGLSKTDNEYGNQLAGLVDSRFAGAITLVREGSSCPSVTELFKHPQITFWGDLDPAGVQIYLRLKRRLPQLELSALYRPMIAMLDSLSCSHPYVGATGKQGQLEMKANCPPHDEIALDLLKRCNTRGVDQECVPPNDISSLAGYQLKNTSDMNICNGELPPISMAGQIA